MPKSIIRYTFIYQRFYYEDSSLTLEDLRAFSEACEAGSLSEAGRRLGRSQPAVAQHVRRLESELGTALLERRSRGVTPTRAGHVLYDGARAVLNQLETTRREIEATMDHQHNKLAIAATASAVSGFLRPAILQLHRHRPEVEMHLEMANTAEERLDAVRKGSADLAFIPVDACPPELEVRLGCEMPLLLLVSRKDRLAGRRRLRIGDLSGLHYISLGESTATFRHIRRAVAGAGVLLEAATEVQDPGAAIFMVELGRGHTFITAAQVPSVEKAGLAKAIEIDGLPPLRLGWAARSFASIPKAANEFLRLFDEWSRHIVSEKRTAKRKRRG